MGYNTTSVFFHWVTAVWVITMMILGIVFSDMSFRDPLYLPLSAAHLTLGLFGLVFFPIRVVRRLMRGFSPHPEHHIIERIAARAVQYVFMILLIIVPITGLIVVLADGGWSIIFGIELPAVYALGGLYDIASDGHDVLTKVLAGAMFLHIAGAIKHAVIDRDDTLTDIVKPTEGGR